MLKTERYSTAWQQMPQFFFYPTFKLENIKLRAKSKDQSDNVRNFDEGLLKIIFLLLKRIDIKSFESIKRFDRN